MKKILISIKPKWIAKILNGEKTLEIRKSAPKCELPCEVYIYCTKEKILGNLIKVGSEENSKLFGKNAIVGINKGFMESGDIDLQGKVIAKFTLKKTTPIGKDMFGYCPFTSEILDGEWLGKGSCLTQNDLRRYLGDKTGYAWHIDHLVIFDKPKELEEFEYPNPSGVRNIGQRAIKGLPSKKHPPQSWCYCEVEE